MNPQPVLTVANVSKSFRGLKAISDVSLKIHQGEIMGLIGPNGAGKTTLFNLITGFLKPDTGQITFRDHSLIGLKAHQICKLGVTRTFQIVKPFAHLSTLENVAVGAFNTADDIGAAEDKSWEVMSFVGLEQKALEQASSLTLPDRKRLELARALATEPKLLLLDEVMAGLNPTEQHELIDLVFKIRESGTTIFIIEHHMRVIMGISDRIVVLHHGEVIADNMPQNVCMDETVIEAYLGKGVQLAEALENVDVHYGEVQVLRQVSLDIEQGEIVSLLGSNGAGKSTCVNCISGVLPISAGTIEFMGEDIGKVAPHKRVESGLIQIPEGRRVFPTLTVRENLEMGSFLKKPKALRQETMEFVMDMFPVLRERTQQMAGTLSGGEQQMLAIGRGLMSKPKLLILDEPSLGLAPLMVAEIFEVVVRIKQEGVTILLVEQNAPQALGISDRASVLEEGRVGLSGSGKDLMNDPHVRKMYLGL